MVTYVLILPEDLYLDMVFVARSKQELLDAITLGFRELCADYPGHASYNLKFFAALRRMVRTQVSEDLRGMYDLRCIEPLWVSPAIVVTEDPPAFFNGGVWNFYTDGEVVK